MNVDGNDVIEILAQRIAKLEVELAVKTAQVEALSKNQQNSEVAE